MDKRRKKEIKDALKNEDYRWELIAWILVLFAMFFTILSVIIHGIKIGELGLDGDIKSNLVFLQGMLLLANILLALGGSFVSTNRSWWKILYKVYNYSSSTISVIVILMFGFLYIFRSAG